MTDSPTDQSADLSTARSVVLVREHPVPPERVVAAWTDPDQLAWFSGLPAAQSDPHVDLRVGGFWSVLLQEGPGGRTYRTGGLYTLVDPPHRLEFHWGAPGGWPDLDPAAPGTVPTVRLRFSAVPAGTRMTATLELGPDLDEAQVAHWFGLGIREGWTTTVDRIEDHLRGAAVQ
ncbi:SRPBCC domain-containing protein [Kineococcus endophyticus]|uniref:SRPBCC domain-containing protein n=1 Tax=Kineococcus endophyticus TaxID=1181883 RepID=A0ABV3P838_9ACTN